MPAGLGELLVLLRVLLVALGLVVPLVGQVLLQHSEFLAGPHFRFGLTVLDLSVDKAELVELALVDRVLLLMLVAVVVVSLVSITQIFTQQILSGLRVALVGLVELALFLVLPVLVPQLHTL